MSEELNANKREETDSEKQENLVGFFALLMEVDKRINPPNPSEDLDNSESWNYYQNKYNNLHDL